MPAPLIPIVMMILEGLGIAASVAALTAATSAHAAGGSPEEIARAAAAAHEAEGGAKINPTKIKRVAASAETEAMMGRAMTGALRGEAAAAEAATAARRKKWLGGEGRLARGGGKLFNLALFATFMMPMLEMFRGSGRAEGGLPEMGIGGGRQEDLLALMSALGQQGGGRMSEGDMKYMRGAQTMAERRNVFGAEPSSLGAGRADLDALIQGNRDLLGRISYNEPVSFAQAMAQHGLYNAMSQPHDMSQFIPRDMGRYPQ